MTENVVDDKSYPPLNAWSDLPQQGEMAIFEVGNQLVGFTPHLENETVVAWGVTTAVSDYQGILVKQSDTITTASGQEAAYIYSFRMASPAVEAIPASVTLDDFKEKFFGVYPQA